MTYGLVPGCDELIVGYGMVVYDASAPPGQLIHGRILEFKKMNELQIVTSASSNEDLETLPRPRHNQNIVNALAQER